MTRVVNEMTEAWSSVFSGLCFGGPLHGTRQKSVGRDLRTADGAVYEGEQFVHMEPNGMQQTLRVWIFRPDRRHWAQCSFCDKPREDARKMVDCLTAQICDECVAKAADVIAQDDQQGWLDEE